MSFGSQDLWTYTGCEDPIPEKMDVWIRNICLPPESEKS